MMLFKILLFVFTEDDVVMIYFTINFVVFLFLFSIDRYSHH